MATTTTNTNEYLDFDDADLASDFGFSFGDEEELVADAIAPAADEITDLKKRLIAVNKIYMPLLENLAKNSDKPIIKWPNRGPILEKQIAKLKTLTDVTL